MIINLNGQKVKLLGQDLNEDGVLDDIEEISPQLDRGIQPIVQKTELGESIQEINKDDMDPNDRMSSIDLRSNLPEWTALNIQRFDSAVSFGLLPTSSSSITRVVKRQWVSVNGRGRDDVVNIVAGKREQEAKTGILERARNNVQSFFQKND